MYRWVEKLCEVRQVQIAIALHVDIVDTIRISHILDSLKID